MKRAVGGEFGFFGPLFRSSFCSNRVRGPGTNTKTPGKGAAPRGGPGGRGSARIGGGGDKNKPHLLATKKTTKPIFKHKNGGRGGPLPVGRCFRWPVFQVGGTKTTGTTGLVAGRIFWICRLFSLSKRKIWGPQRGGDQLGGGGGGGREQRGPRVLFGAVGRGAGVRFPWDGKNNTQKKTKQQVGGPVGPGWGQNTGGRGAWG